MCVSTMYRKYEPVELVQFCSSLTSPQSGNPSHLPSREMISPLSQENIDNGLKSSFEGAKSGIRSLASKILSRIKVMQHINYDHRKQYYSSVNLIND